MAKVQSYYAIICLHFISIAPFIIQLSLGCFTLSTIILTYHLFPALPFVLDIVCVL